MNSNHRHFLDSSMKQLLILLQLIGGVWLLLLVAMRFAGARTLYALRIGPARRVAMVMMEEA